jgi:phosphodiesterase/alkaline phosphatase D-like protein
MNNHKKATFIVTAFIFMSFTLTNYSDIIDYLSIGNKISFNNDDYILKSSSNPLPNNFKQEYVKKNENSNSIHTFITIEATKGNTSVLQAAKIKIQDLEISKLKYNVINYQKFENKLAKETIIDYLIHDGNYIYEWNIYRYQQQVNVNDTSLVIFEFTYRDSLNSEKDLETFFTYTQANRMKMINTVGSVIVPKVEIKN